ncbi:MAG: tetratricopeptide repeat protein [Treponema sp.]|nr:tetratricopeptide repeat protein [Treponema sp.]
MQSGNEKISLSKSHDAAKDSGFSSEKLNEFFSKNRKGILVITGVVIFLLIGLIAFFVISDNLEKKAIAGIEELNEKYEELYYNINDDEHSAEVNSLLAELETFAGNKKGFAASKAWSLTASIHSGREDFSKAEEAWVKSAQTGEKTYLGPIAYFQAAIAAEKQNRLEKAIEYLTKCTSHSFEFPDGPRAQFNIGRLYEQLGNKPLAIEAYRALLLNYQWEYDTMNPVNLFWHNLARDRIIILEI